MRIIYFLIPLIFIAMACGILDSSKDQDKLPGKIVFSAEDSTGTEQIYTMYADGSGINKLTDFLPSELAINPSWRPDGKKIIFSSWKFGTSAGPALWVMDADGSNQHVLYDPEPDNIHVPPIAGKYAQWSPDGRKVVYELCVNCQLMTNLDILIFDTVSKDIKQLTTPPFSEGRPDWNPVDDRIVFVSDRDYKDADSLRFRDDLYVMDAEGNNVNRITQTGYAGQPLWNPNGEAITFYSSSSHSVYQINLQSDSISLLKKGLSDTIHLLPNAWGPDGRYLLITAFDYEYPRTNTLYILDLEDNELQSIYSRSSYDNANRIIHGADWNY
ncbi:MAG: hypothetical protein GF313_05985 [Caldithrix sp.]|nr:hypothetical protein [Caldithrix sp.]